ncbi:MAG TPA: hypothetical protein VHD55_04015 [Candidatus Paceibacterota bacterium]|nr:hypothetical protein [Candidatus Paceibacterota bacterium]
MRLTIAAPLFPPQIGGPAKYAKELFDELNRRGLKPRLVVWGRAERLLPWGARHLWYFFRLLPRVIGSDAVLALDTWSVGFPALCAAKLCGEKFLARVGGDILWEGYIERTGEMVPLSGFYATKRNFTLKERVIYGVTGFLARHAGMLLFNTLWQMEIWRKAYNIDIGRMRLLENEYSGERHETPAPRGKKIFLAAGRGIAYKNIAGFEEAFSEAAKRHPDIELDTRPLPREEHLARLAGIYAYVVPSVSEVNSNNIIEALKYGKPFMAPRDSGMFEKLQGLGVFADTLDKKAMEAGLEELLDAEKYKQYVGRIRAFSYTHSWAQIADEVLDTANSIA